MLVGKVCAVIAQARNPGQVSGGQSHVGGVAGQSGKRGLRVDARAGNGGQDLTVMLLGTNR